MRSCEGEQEEADFMIVLLYPQAPIHHSIYNPGWNERFVFVAGKLGGQFAPDLPVRRFRDDGRYRRRQRKHRLNQQALILLLAGHGRCGGSTGGWRACLRRGRARQSKCRATLQPLGEEHAKRLLPQIHLEFVRGASDVEVQGVHLCREAGRRLERHGDAAQACVHREPRRHAHHLAELLLLSLKACLPIPCCHLPPGDIPQSEFAGAELDQNVQAVAEHRVAHNTGAPENDGGHPARSTHLVRAALRRVRPPLSAAGGVRTLVLRFGVHISHPLIHGAAVRRCPHCHTCSSRRSLGLGVQSEAAYGVLLCEEQHTAP
mmetsp:Transcript_49673/g.94930  ORF Transcript_49673/g.94930 Transcript_49673/m.94930 type:complete len:318 (+) Transcript_49673:664-1617(+)